MDCQSFRGFLRLCLNPEGSCVFSQSRSLRYNHAYTAGILRRSCWRVELGAMASSFSQAERISSRSIGLSLLGIERAFQGVFRPRSATYRKIVFGSTESSLAAPRRLHPSATSFSSAASKSGPKSRILIRLFGSDAVLNACPQEQRKTPIVLPPSLCSLQSVITDRPKCSAS